ncbi:MAG: hypothetical protein U9R20_05530 [Thermodesulfobacteriota bacterium]|nr:hypothetical protein [Thermodesulfobacteriota bacterium]
MKRKILVLSVIFAVFAMLALPTSVFAWAHSGQITAINMWESGTIFIEVTDSETFAYSKVIDPSLPADQIRQMLALALTAQANGDDVTIFIVSGKIRSITCP